VSALLWFRELCALSTPPPHEAGPTETSAAGLVWNPTCQGGFSLRSRIFRFEGGRLHGLDGLPGRDGAALAFIGLV
jgi:hypothetical protein